MKILDIDFSARNNNDADYARLQALIDGLDVAILINNVGLSHNMPVPFVQTTSEEMDGIIEINCRATLKVTQAVVKGMVQRKRGLVLTMGSFGGLVPTPLLATYSGSKAFLQHWSTALGSELAPKGVTVELVQSYLVTSKMSKIRKSSAMVPTPRQFVKATMGKIGRTGGAQGWAFTSTPWWAHAAFQFAMAQIVTAGNAWLLWWNRGAHEDIRKTALRKMKREKKKGN